jgi:hypothetical protein
MVVHQAVGEEPEPEAQAAIGDGGQIRFAVRIITKDCLPLIASGDDVVDPPVSSTPRAACSSS